MGCIKRMASSSVKEMTMFSLLDNLATCSPMLIWWPSAMSLANLTLSFLALAESPAKCPPVMVRTLWGGPSLALFILVLLTRADGRGVLALCWPTMTSLLIYSYKYHSCISLSIWSRSLKHSAVSCPLSLWNFQYLDMFLHSTGALIVHGFWSRFLPSTCMRICSLEVLSGV